MEMKMELLIPTTWDLSSLPILNLASVGLTTFTTVSLTPLLSLEAQLAEKHLQIRQDAEQRYMAMLERAFKLFADQIIGYSVAEIDRQNYHGPGYKILPDSSQESRDLYHLQSAEVIRVHGPEVVPPRVRPQRADCSTESCLTSHESPAGLPLEVSPAGGKKRMLRTDSATGSLIRGVNQI